MPGEASWELIKEGLSAVVGWMNQITWLGKSVLEWGFYVFLLSAAWGFLLQPLFGGRDLVSPGSDAVRRYGHQRKAEKNKQEKNKGG